MYSQTKWIRCIHHCHESNRYIYYMYYLMLKHKIHGIITSIRKHIKHQQKQITEQQTIMLR